MTYTEKQQETILLVHWTYSREEWQRFIRWQKQKQGFLYYIVYLVFLRAQRPTPEIRITAERVWIGDAHQQFSSDLRQLKKIDIRDEGKLNIMEITYEWVNRKTAEQNEIRIPVPKGKLREAINVQEKLMQGVS